MVSPRKNEVSDKAFVAVDNEITSKLFGFFMLRHESG